MTSFDFPPWVNKVRPLLGVLIPGSLLYVVCLFTWGASPLTTDRGYQPEQPVPYSHAQHVGKLGLDCRYCHTSVERAAFAAVPPTQTCMNCHHMVRAQSAKLAGVRESWVNDTPISWVKVHDLADFAYFDHSAHVTRGVGCVSCHGRVDKMDVVYQDQPLSMGWCLECHRNPEAHLRPPEMATRMDWVPPRPQLAYGAELRAAHGVNPPQDCSTCHR